MYDLIIALQTFWRSFGIATYESTDPRIEDSITPKLIYNAQQGTQLGSMTDSINLYYKATDRANLMRKADEIAQVLQGGKVIKCGTGNIVIWDIEWQTKTDEDKTIAALYGNFAVDYNF